MRGARDETSPDLTLIARHLRFGWWSVALFATFGLCLELLHGLKLGAYLEAENETRRLLWTLAHAHGTLLGLLHLGFAYTVGATTGAVARLGSASLSLRLASVLLPGGFFLGGVQFYAGDPGWGVVLVPVGAVLTIYAAVVTARTSATARAAGAVTTTTRDR